MLELIIIYFIGKYFYELAKDFNQNKWLFVVIGVLTYFVGAVIGVVILMALDASFGFGIDWESRLLLTFLLMPFAIASCYLLYTLLKKRWQKTIVISKDEIDEIGKEVN
ncbi:MAG: hypothetical protein R2802_01535 [Flavobacteriaceae bacterium]|nr:hypothetical protein [Mangrovimonas sp.]HRV54026.1 hypothetical protein [Mangrovimonas sp.]